MTRDELLHIFEARIQRPVSARELLQLLKIPREARVGVRRQLRGLAADGSLVVVRGHQFTLPGRGNQLVGRLRMHPDGYGFVSVEHDDPARRDDVYIPSARLEQAMHGDRVVVRVDRARDEGRREGRVVRVLDRANARVVGRYEVGGAGPAWVVPHEHRLATEIRIPPGEGRSARPGDMVVAEITRWPTETRGPVGRVAEVLGPAAAPGVDTTVVIRKHGIPEAHGAEALAEAARFAEALGPADLAGRTDFRAWPIVTIDGADARDFDDAVSVERLTNGHLWLGVHVADVTHYVAEGSALDEDAYERGTSVYFPDRAVHMLPARLASGLCSLQPHVDRLVQSCLMEIDPHGEVVRYELHDGVIRSAARLTYDDVDAMLADTDAGAATRARYAEVLPLITRMREAFDRIHARRRRRGAIDFDLPKPEVVLDAAGLVASILRAERNVAHRLIEECMLIANETVARHLAGRAFPALYRVHGAPDSFKVEAFSDFVGGLGFTFDHPPSGVRPRDFQRLVERVRGAPEERPVAFLMLRTMQLARYEAENGGHFGLALDTYTHFTSPIRRYPDLVVHRLLRHERLGTLSAAARDGVAARLPDIARQCSDRERRAMEAERELVQWKQARFMADKVGEEFAGVVTGVAPFGLFVELTEHFVEGLVHLSELAPDEYSFSDVTHQLRGARTRATYRLGDRVAVRVLRVDAGRRKIELGLVRGAGRDETGRATAAGRRRGASRGAAREADRPGRGPRRAAVRREGRPRRARRRR